MIWPADFFPQEINGPWQFFLKPTAVEYGNLFSDIFNLFFWQYGDWAQQKNSTVTDCSDDCVIVSSWIMMILKTNIIYTSNLEIDESCFLPLLVKFLWAICPQNVMRLTKFFSNQYNLFISSNLKSQDNTTRWSTTTVTLIIRLSNFVVYAHLLY